MTQTLTTPPSLSGFTTHHGIPVAILGDDGDQFVALGHHDKVKTLAAFARMTRVDLGWRLADEHTVSAGDPRHEAWVVATTCGECRDDPECSTCREIRAVDWWLRPATDADTGAFPVTVLTV